jgi:hypothetical protein
MIEYFGYGSNLDMTSLKAKGVSPRRSRAAVLRGWRLRFNVEHFFPHEGGMGNIERTDDPADQVLGVLHACDDRDLRALDVLEAYGIGYDRIETPVTTADGPVRATAYVGLPDFINDACRPTRRYLNILLRGAEAARLDPAYIAALRGMEALEHPDLPPFAPPAQGARAFAPDDLLRDPLLTAIGGAVFDMRGARPRHDILKTWFGGKDVTLFHLRRLDTSDGSETAEQIKSGALRDDQRRYLNVYLHAFAREYAYVGWIA